MNLKELFLSRLENCIITEAFQAQSMSKVLDLVGRYLTKTFGSQARWANEGEITAIVIGGQKLFSVSYYFANGSELRLGFKTIAGGSFSIVRIDYWKPGFTPVKHNTVGAPIADYTITFDQDVSVAQIFPKILPAIKSIIAKGSAKKSIDILIRPKTAELMEGEKTYTGSKSDIVRKMLKAGETKDAIYAQIGNDASAKSLVSKIGKELGIVVTAKITPAGNKTETVSPSTAAAIKRGYKLIPRYSDISTVYDDLNLLLDATVLKKKFNALVVTGSTGTGKTQNVMTFLKEHGLKSSDEGGDDADYMIIKGGNVSAFALFQNFFMFRESGKLILIDDADSAFEDSTKNNLLKAVLDSYDKRFVSWETKNPNVFKVNGSNPIKEGSPEWEMEIMDGKFPNRFAYSGQVIIVSNMHITDFDAAVRGRSVCVDITVKSEDMLNRIETLINQGQTFAGADKATMLKTLKFMKSLPGNNRSAGEYWPGTTYSKDDYIMVKEDEMDLNFRTYMTVLKFSTLGFPDTIWQRLAMKYAGIPAKLLEGSPENKDTESE